MRRFDETRTLDHIAGEIDDDAGRRARPRGGGGARQDTGVKTPAVEPERWIAALGSYIDEHVEAFGQHPEIFPAAASDELARSKPHRLRAHRSAVARARPARFHPPHPRRSASRQYRPDRRQAGPVRRHRVQRHHRVRRRVLRSRLPADGPARARARACRQYRAQPLSRARRAGSKISTPSPRCRSSSRCGRPFAPKSPPRGWSGRLHAERAAIARAARAYFEFARARDRPACDRNSSPSAASPAPANRVLARDAGARMSRRCRAPSSCAPTSSARRCSALSETEKLPESAYTRRGHRARLCHARRQSAPHRGRRPLGRSSTPCSQSRRSAPPSPRGKSRRCSAAGPVPHRRHGDPACAASAAASDDASDADAAVARAQEHYELGPLEWAEIDASGTSRRDRRLGPRAWQNLRAAVATDLD